MLYSAAGRTTATAATADNFGAALWNPDANRALYVKTVSWFKVTATADYAGLVRISARGTQSSTVTPDADNAYDRAAAPPSACVLDIAYSGQPTAATPYLVRMALPAAIGASWVWVFSGMGLRVPAGTGLGVATPVATILQAADVTFEWEE
jgi:hypothetical protein